MVRALKPRKKEKGAVAFWQLKDFKAMLHAAFVHSSSCTERFPPACDNKVEVVGAHESQSHT